MMINGWESYINVANWTYNVHVHPRTHHLPNDILAMWQKRTCKVIGLFHFGQVYLGNACLVMSLYTLSEVGSPRLDFEFLSSGFDIFTNSHELCSWIWKWSYDFTPGGVCSISQLAALGPNCSFAKALKERPVLSANRRRWTWYDWWLGGGSTTSPSILHIPIPAPFPHKVRNTGIM